MKLLLVEPDTVSARATRTALMRDGHQVTVVTSGQHAIDVLDEQPHDALVLEPQLGLHNGIELLYELRSYPEWQALPVVMWTLNRQLSQPVYQAPLRQLGVRDVLYKPTSSLSRLIRSVAAVAP